MKIAEPTTSLTDFLIAVESVYLGSLLLFRSDQWSVLLWGIALYFLAASAVSGAFYHAWTPDQWQTVRKRLPVTIASMMLLALIFMLYGGVVSSFTGSARIVLFALVHILPVLAFFIIPRIMGRQIRNQTSRFGIGVLITVFVLTFIVQIAFDGPEAGTWILAGGIACMAGVWAQQSGYQLHKHMNHNDICHLFFMIGIYFLYRGASLLLDK